MRPLTQIIDLAALKENFNLLCSRAQNSKRIAVVKADAYGCGTKIVHALPQADYFAVACTEEALAIRQYGATQPVVLLEGWFELNEIEIAYSHNFIPVISTQQHLDWIIHSDHTFNEVWLNIDTGMTRLGFLPHEAKNTLADLRKKYKPSQIVLMSHFSSADECNVMTQKQFDTFNALNENLSDTGNTYRHCLSNSAAALMFTKAQRDIVRFGITMYGVSPFNTRLKELTPVVTLKTKVISVKHVSAGTHIGYGHTVALDSPSYIAVIAVGYADGYPREHITPPPVMINGNKYRTIGRISMDMMTIKVDDSVSVNDEVELWGKQLPIETVAKDIGTIPYTLLTNIATRVHRHYLD